jgi:lauroyl/myristoyl acyltransferase
MCPVIDNPASCDIHAVISFRHAKNMSVAEIHPASRTVYDLNVMSEGTVRQLCRMFKDGQTNFHEIE